ncbi:MAG: RidA family protein [Candidatus Baldrarchaeia archaeon]|mgnify:CR=1 FL=1
MGAEEKLAKLGIRLPEPPKPVAAYVPAVRVGNLIFVSGQIPMEQGELKFKGKVGKDLNVEQGYEAARLCAINALSIIKGLVGSLNKVKRVVRVTGYVNSADGFSEQHKVLNGASEFLREIFGEKGLHSRVAVGVSGLPLDAAVEVEMIVEVED